jgi:hypothetical protein
MHRFRSDNANRPANAVRAFALAVGLLLLGLSMTVQAQHPGEILRTGEDEPCAAEAQAERDHCLRKQAAREARMRRASRDYHAWLADRLAADGSARDLALAANLRAMSLAGELFHSGATLPQLADDARLAEWIERGARDGHDDPFVQMLLTRPFHPQDAARRKTVRDAWRAADPDNLAALPDDEGPVDEILAAAADARRFDVYYGTLLRSVLTAMERHPPSSRFARHLLDETTPTVPSYAATLGVSMLELPRFSPAVDACKGDALAQPGRREACMRYGGVLAEASDTLIAHMIGLAILRNSAVDAEGRERIEQRRRGASWIWQQWHEVVDRNPIGFADWQADALRASPGIAEMTLMRQALEANGISAEPPAEYRHVPML